MKVFLSSRAFLILSFLWLLSLPSYAYFQNATARVKTKYEFTDTRISEADTLLKKRQYQEALDAYQKAYDIYEAESFYEGMVYAKERMGRTYRSLRKDSLSKITYQAAAALSREKLGPNHILESKAYLNNGIRAHFKNTFIDASRTIDSSMWSYESSNFYDSTMLRNLIDFKFYTYYYSNLSRDTLIKYLNLKAGFFEKEGSSLNQNIYLLSDHNRAYYAIGDFQKSVAYGIEAVRLSEQNLELIEPFYYTDALFNLGRALLAQKKYIKAYEVSTRLLEFTLENDPNNSDLTGYMNLQAVTLNALKRFNEASVVFRKIIGILEEKNIEGDFYSDAIMNLGVCYERMGRFDLAEKELKNALDLQKGRVDYSDVALVRRYRHLGQLFYAKEDFTSATSYYDSALREGILDYNSGILDIPENGDFNATYELLSVLNNKLLSIEKSFIEDHLDSIELANSVLEYSKFTHGHLISNRENLLASEGKLFLSQEFKTLYESALNVAYMKHKISPNNEKYIDEGSLFMAFSKSNLFLEQSGELVQIQDSKVPLTTKKRYYSTKKDIDSLEQTFYGLIDQITTSDTLRQINLKLLDLNNKLDFIRDSLDMMSSMANGQRVDEDELTSRINQILKNDPKKVLIEYFMGERFIFVIAIGNDRKFFKRIELTEEFNKCFRNFLTHVSRRPSISGYSDTLLDYQENAHQLFQYLIGDLLKPYELGLDKITIVSDDELSKIPFEALVSSISADAKFYSDLNFLVKDYTINHSLSTREIKASLTPKVASKNLMGIGFSAVRDDNGGLNGRVRSTGSLPGTEEEIKFLQSAVQGDFFLGDEGNKDKFLNEAKQYDVLHLALHGEADSTDRYQSSIIFNGDNGVLKTSDLYVADLNARLAILSACESGVGLVNRGEGTFSIARGFALVGVPSIVMTLWKVNDKTSSRLMTSLHQELQAGLPVSEALTNSKRNFLIESEQFTGHPYYWSAFISLGEDVTVYQEERSLLTLFLVVAIALSVVVFLFAIRINKKKGVKI